VVIECGRLSYYQSNVYLFISTDHRLERSHAGSAGPRAGCGHLLLPRTHPAAHTGQEWPHVPAACCGERSPRARARAGRQRYALMDVSFFNHNPFLRKFMCACKSLSIKTGLYYECKGQWEHSNNIYTIDHFLPRQTEHQGPPDTRLPCLCPLHARHERHVDGPLAPMARRLLIPASAPHSLPWRKTDSAYSTPPLWWSERSSSGGD